MKKILLSLVTLVSLSQAIENWNDIKPHSYGRNNLTVNVLPGTLVQDITTPNGDITRDFAKTFGIGIHSKASLKEYHYKKADFFWAGGFDFNFYQSNIIGSTTTSDIQELKGNLEFGLASHIGNLIYSGSVGGTYTYFGSTADTTSSSHNSYSGYGEVALAHNTRLFTYGVIYRLELEKHDTGYFGYPNTLNLLKNTITVPLQKNLDRNTAISFTPSYSFATDGSFKQNEAKFIFQFSWLYGLK